MELGRDEVWGRGDSEAIHWSGAVPFPSLGAMVEGLCAGGFLSKVCGIQFSERS